MASLAGSVAGGVGTRLLTIAIAAWAQEYLNGGFGRFCI
jgi:hypothetical protein